MLSRKVIGDNRIGPNFWWELHARRTPTERSKYTTLPVNQSRPGVLHSRVSSPPQLISKSATDLPMCEKYPFLHLRLRHTALLQWRNLDIYVSCTNYLVKKTQENAHLQKQNMHHPLLGEEEEWLEYDVVNMSVSHVWTQSRMWSSFLNFMEFQLAKWL